MITRIILPLLMLMSCAGASAQEGTSRLNGWGVPNDPQNCEMNLQDLEHARNLARRETNGFLIIVARLGDRERRRELNYRRLYNIRLQLTRIGLPSDKIVVAEGERVSGIGRVEFYVRGEFIGALPVRRGADICVGCCGPDERFYPYRQDKRRNATGRTQPNAGDEPDAQLASLSSRTRVVAAGCARRVMPGVRRFVFVKYI